MFNTNIWCFEIQLLRLQHLPFHRLISTYGVLKLYLHLLYNFILSMFNINIWCFEILSMYRLIYPTERLISTYGVLKFQGTNYKEDIKSSLISTYGVLKSIVSVIRLLSSFCLISTYGVLKFLFDNWICHFSLININIWCFEICFLQKQK